MTFCHRHSGHRDGRGKEKKKSVKFSDWELQVLMDEVQRLLDSPRTTSRCIREEMELPNEEVLQVFLTHRL